VSKVSDTRSAKHRLTDNHGRPINYLRLAVTDRCNLRCFYCMPGEGIDWLAREDLMSNDEMLRICRILVGMGVEKVRITGGEPFVRRNIMDFLEELTNISGLRKVAITTNGVLTAPYIPDLRRLGISTVNLSLDTLDRNRFFSITRRDELTNVLETLDELLGHGMDVRINAVVMEKQNIQDILNLVELARDLPIGVRFIEEMPFNGADHLYQGLKWDHIRILSFIREAYPDIRKIPDPPFSTSMNYEIPGFRGKIGIIAAYTRSFCGTCNRIRVTPQGMLKTCLYDNGVLNVRDLLRAPGTDDQVASALAAAIGNRSANGWEAEKLRNATDSNHESMATIGG
jgi:molybdenum cofactor biosynthesis protein A